MLSAVFEGMDVCVSFGHLLVPDVDGDGDNERGGGGGRGSGSLQ